MPSVFSGDFNIDTLVNKHLKKQYLIVIDSIGCDMLVEKPTRVAGAAPTCLDYFLPKNISKFSRGTQKSEHYRSLGNPVFLCQQYTSNCIFWDTGFLKSEH